MPEIVPKQNQIIKRVVLLHTLGPYAGLRQIMGTTADFEPGPLPPTVPDITIRPSERKADAWLVKIKQRYVMYQEKEKSNEG